MDIRLLGTGSPVPTVDRGGTSVLLEMDDEPILVDCGPFSLYQMIENGIDPATIETLFFTHHHIDHNADFFGFVIGSWGMGREALSIYGPAGTQAYVDALYDLYEEDIAYREWFGHPSDGIRDISVAQTTADLAVSTDAWSASALPVEHSAETFAYRFEETATGTTCVVSGDTRRIDALPEFAADADVLIQDCGIAPVSDDPSTNGLVHERLMQPMPEESREKHKQHHCDPEDAAWIAEQAGVDTLVLTHLVPYRDQEAMRERVSAGFDGDVIVGEDGMQLSP